MPPPRHNNKKYQIWFETLDDDYCFEFCFVEGTSSVEIKFYARNADSSFFVLIKETPFNEFLAKFKKKPISLKFWKKLEKDEINPEGPLFSIAEARCIYLLILTSKVITARLPSDFVAPKCLP